MARKIKLTLAALFFVAAAAAGYMVGQTAQPEKAHALSGFDHSQCQYPDRTTNPPDGCDNSDPCDPADAAKGGSGECKPAKDYEPGSQKDPNDLPDPNRPYYDQYGNKYDYMGNLIEAAPQEDAPAPASQCSGK